MWYNLNMENFNFLKIEDQERFEKLPQVKKEEVINEAKSEAEKIKLKLKDTYGEAPQEWKDFSLSFRNVWGDAMEKIFNIEDKEKQKYYLKLIEEKQRTSFLSVEDRGKYLSYHKVIGSSTGPVSSPKLDFEGDYSLLKFYTELLEGLKREEILNILKKKYNIEKLPINPEIQILEISRIFNGLDNLKDKKILDLGCGSNYESYDIDAISGKERTFEPWFCRALIEIGAKPIGVDIGSLDGENFEHYRLDLSKSGTLDFLPSESFDAINVRLLFTSPQLEEKMFKTKEDIKNMKIEIQTQINRLLKKDGKIIGGDLNLAV